MIKIEPRRDRELFPADRRTTRYAHIVVTAPDGTGLSRPRARIAFVLDRSGSMAGTKLRLAKQGVLDGVAMLSPGDCFTTVVYDSEVEIISGLAQATSQSKAFVREGLASIHARYGTNLSGGWLAGCRELAKGLNDGEVARCLLLTDGLANQGIWDHDVLRKHARELHMRGISTTTLGVGADFDEDLLQSMAREGGGHFYFVEATAQLPDYLMSELGETLEVTARDVSLEFEPPEGVIANVVSNFSTTRDSNRFSIHLGHLCANQMVEVVVAFTLPATAAGRDIEVPIHVKDSDGEIKDLGELLWWRATDLAANKAQARDLDVVAAVADQQIARAHQKALGFNREGNLDMSVKYLQACGDRILEEHGPLRLIVERVRKLREDAQMYADRMDALERKRRYSHHSSQLTSRDVYGRSRITSTSGQG